jgi:hypothetical protein
MQKAVRSYLMTGVALVGTGAIVLSPISVAPPEVHVPAVHASAVSVDLAAAINPITEWVQVLQTTFNNLAALGVQVQSDPAPLLQQFITNQLANVALAAPALEQAAGSVVAGVTGVPASLLTAATQLAAGNFSDAVQTVFGNILGLVLAPVISLLPLSQITTDATQNFANVVAAIPNILLPIGLAALSPVAGAVYTFGNTGQEVIDGLRTGDVASAISAIVNAPAAFTDAIFNGVPAEFSVGLFSPANGDFGSGLFAALLSARDTLAQALGAPVPPAPMSARREVAKLPSAAATVTLSTTAPKRGSSGRSAIVVKPPTTKSAPATAVPDDSSTGGKPGTSAGSVPAAKHGSTGKSAGAPRKAGHSAKHSGGTD